MSNGSDGKPTIGGRYEVDGLLGRGGMAEVRKGTDTRLGRVVAIKRLRTDLASDPTFQARFRREAQSAASLNHPAIVSVYDTGEEVGTAADGVDSDGVPQPYIVMEYVAGRTLREILREGRKILPERALEITSGVLSALDYSHRAGIVHRDIKPANVMLTPSGDVKVMDFGIARAMADVSTTMTATAAVVGTAQYLSPEQARGETVDSRSDVYSTGCLLYELLTGRPPFVGESPVAVAIQHVREEAPPPSTLDEDLAPEVDAIVMKALAKRIEDRYQSAAAMRADIERYLAGKPVAAPAVLATANDFVPGDPPTEATSIFGARPDQEPEEEQPRKKWPIVLVVLAVLALLVGAAVLGPMLFSSAPEQKSVPDVQGMTQAVAERTLEDAGLALGSVTEEASTEFRKGRIISQDPEARSLVDPGAEVDVVVSTGAPTVVVPYVIGKDKNQAADELRAAGLEPQLIRERSDNEQDTVIRTDPEPAASVSEGATVKVYWSTGPREVPSVVGKQLDEARRILDKAGFEVEVTYDSQTQADKGQVLKQSPEAYTEQPQGTRILLTVSSYEPPSQTPEPSPSPSPSQATSTPPSPSSSPSVLPTP